MILRRALVLSVQADRLNHALKQNSTLTKLDLCGHYFSYRDILTEIESSLKKNESRQHKSK